MKNIFSSVIVFSVIVLFPSCNEVSGQKENNLSALTNSSIQLSEQKTENISSSDTCFYSLDIPPDLDVPTTPHFDTTIVRNKTCKVQMLRLPSQGTETRYIITRGHKTIKDITLFHDKETNLVDITEWSAGNYGVSLLACGNGGGFGLTIK